jgi:hypothetical protein
VSLCLRGYRFQDSLRQKHLKIVEAPAQWLGLLAVSRMDGLNDKIPALDFTKTQVAEAHHAGSEQ